VGATSGALCCPANGTTCWSFVACGVVTLAWLGAACASHADEDSVRHGLVYGLLAFVAQSLLVAPAADALRTALYTMWGGLSDASVALARGPRHSWTSATVDELIAELGNDEAKLVALDVINARAGQLLHGLVAFLWYVLVVPEQRVRLWAMGVHHTLHVLTKAVLLRSSGYVAAASFHRCRIREGSGARLNALFGDAVALALAPLAQLILLACLGSKQVRVCVCVYGVCVSWWVGVHVRV
jgi:hypothetical protein